jgi:hypothetical protein
MDSWDHDDDDENDEDFQNDEREIDSEGAIIEDIITETTHDAVDLEATLGDHPAIAHTIERYEFTWALPVPLNDDRHLIADLGNVVTFTRRGVHANRPRLLTGRNGHTRFHFDERELKILSTPTAWLNDVCINGGATLLHNLLSAPTLPSAVHSQRCALLSSFDLVHIRSDASDDVLWRSVCHSLYWTKDIWILPIHRTQPKHWVLCSISWSTNELFLFDSLAAREPWHKDIQDIIRLLDRFVELANRKGHACHLISDGWKARPLQVCSQPSIRKKGSNVPSSSLRVRAIVMIVDCGCSLVWVPCCAAFTVRWHARTIC